MSFKSLPASLNFCLFALLITEAGKELNSPNLMDVSVFPLNFVNFYLVCFEPLSLGIYIVNIVTLSCELALITIKWPLLSLVIVLVSKSTVSDSNVATWASL